MMERLKTLLACAGLFALALLFVAVAQDETRAARVHAERAR